MYLKTNSKLKFEYLNKTTPKIIKNLSQLKSELG